MTPVREAMVLPLMFLTVILSGGFRLAGDVKLVPPTLTALILAIPLVGLLIRSGTIPVTALLNGARRPMANVSGGIVLATLFGASAQVLNLLIPDAGLLHAAFAIFVFVQLMTIGATRVERPATLRALLVLFGSLFVLRYIVVEALYAPGGGMLHRVLVTLMSGASLGGITYEPNAPLTGYVAFFTVALYFIAVLLTTRPQTMALVRSPAAHETSLRQTLPVILVLSFTGSSACQKPSPTVSQETGAQPKTTSEAAATPPVTAAQRAAALRSARVWQPPAIAVAQARLDRNPPDHDALDEKAIVDCRLVVKRMSGTTPKFDCELPGHEVIRVKYGRGNPELHAEIAATRLLSALGFFADRMYVVAKVRCAGCTMFPFQSLKCLGETRIEKACFPGGLDYESRTEFDAVAIERRFEGRRVESTPDQGWAWYEIENIEEAAGGSPTAHVDGLKLLAVLLAHWDNKAENQRLLCLPGADLPDGGCSRPIAMLQDLGASFGPIKLDLQNWRSMPIWADSRRCRVSMEQLPWGGGTFPEQDISEQGRVFVLSLLEQLSAAQLRDLFASARVEYAEAVTAASRQPEAWAAAFLDKVRQIREAGPCNRDPGSDRPDARTRGAGSGP
jgi:hypothetical protein